MKRLKIGYNPHGTTLQHPADRRRLVYWAKKRGHEIILGDNQKVDVRVLAGRSNFVKAFESKEKVPIILDLVDGYLGQEKTWRDWARGAGKVVTGQISGKPKPYRRIVAAACQQAQAVICETLEQRQTILPFCANTHSILDFHDEFPMLTPHSDQKNLNFTQLMWEGLPFTLSGLLELEFALRQLSVTHRTRLQVITDLTYPALLGSFFTRKTEKLLGNIPKILKTNLSIKEWSIDSVIDASQSSDLAVLPLNPQGMLNPLKAENRLLILWRLGLPVLTSPTLAYIRVMKATENNGICYNQHDWKVKMEEFLVSSELRRESVQKGQLYIRETHSEAKLLRAWDDLFKSVL